MAGAALERVLQKLHGVKTISNGWVAKCPAHEDHVQSLQISERTDESVGLHCHAGCDKTALLNALGLRFADLYASDSKTETIVATYDYKDLDGTLLYQAVRYSPKAFKQRRPDPSAKGGWSWNMLPLKGKHVAYRLPELKGQNVVTICEGEKDCDRLWSCGIPATTNIGGALKWGQSETQSLKRAGVSRVVIIPDNDEAGHQHAERVARSIKSAKIAVSVLELPDLEPKGDVSTWLMNGGSPHQLQELLNKPYVVAPGTVPVIAEPTAPVVFDGLDVTQYHLNDRGIAEALRDRYGDRLRFDQRRELWLVWDQHYWRPDNDQTAFRLGHDHVRLFQGEAIHVSDFLQRTEYLEFALGRERLAPMGAMMTYASKLLPIRVSGDAWDQDPWLLGTATGVIDLRTGQLRPGVPTDNISQQTGVPFDGHAECPRWLTFLDEVFESDAALIDFVHKAVGYSLTGDMREQCFFLLIGSGSNGKSIFLNTLEMVLGTYGTRANMRMFVGDPSDFYMADLVGSRMIFGSEAKPDTRLNEHVIKSLTGGETQKADRKYGHPFTFRPIGKIWLAVNHPPKVLDDSYGFWRRLRLIPFDRTFSGSTDDRLLRDRLFEESAGILRWAVAGTQRWLADGLVPPQAVVTATDEYQTAEDPLVEFIADRCELDAEGVETFEALYSAYNMWAEKQRIPRSDRMRRREMGTHLKRRFVTKDLAGTRRYAGLRLKQFSGQPYLDD